MEVTARNAQRLALEKFLVGLPSDLVEKLRPVDWIYYPELSSLLAPVISRANQAHDRCATFNGDIQIDRSSSWETVSMRFLDWSHQLPKGEYVLVVGGGNGHLFDGEASWISALPGYRVWMPGGQHVFGQMPKLAEDGLLIASPDGKQAVVLEACCGRLENDAGTGEVIYEVAAWGLN